MIDMKLKTFVDVVETRSYTKAALRLHLTQPAVTQHIKQLEHHYQQILIQNPHKEFTLTKAGRCLYEYAKIQIHNEEIFEAQIQKIMPPLVIGSTLSIADYYLPEIIAPFITASAQPCKIVVNNTSMLLQKMMDGEVDCAFVEGKFDTQLFDFHLFQEDRFIPVAKATHPLAKQNLVFSDILKYPLFIREEGSGTRSILELYLRQSMYSLTSFQKVIEVQSLTMMCKMMMVTEGITFVYEGVVKQQLQAGTLVRLHLSDFPLLHAMYFIYLKSNLEKDTFDTLFQNLMKAHSNVASA